ncbi:DUF3331 domain-containing protein [Paraburkholderia sp. GAS32]|uniref:DUF3331 domain-containing protein n=1 Tax=Paraburkholderia sp. GAS32 TaxID=3035129 RepID=UPI003D25BE76
MIETNANAWLQTVKAICRLGGAWQAPAAPSSSRGSRRPVALPNWSEHNKPTVRVIDKPTAQTLTESWRDALSGHYGHQTWRLAIARKSGTCVLTGRPIARGDAVYRPRGGATPPNNAGAMITADGIGFAVAE